MIHKNIFLIVASIHDSESISLIFMVLLSALLVATLLIIFHFGLSYLQKRKYNRYLTQVDAERAEKFANIKEQINKQRDEIRRQREEREKG